MYVHPRQQSGNKMLYKDQYMAGVYSQPGKCAITLFKRDHSS